MEEYDFCKEIMNIYKVEELNSETLKYRINKFIYACGMDLTDSIWSEDISKTNLPYVCKKKSDGDITYNINFARDYDREKGKNFILIGQYNELKLMLVNYFEKDKRKDIVNEIPFHILLSKEYMEATYQLEIKNIHNLRAKFILKKNKANDMLPSIVAFQSNVVDFGKILKLVKSFVYNPDLVFKVYDEKLNSKEIVFTNKDLDAALVVDDKLDKPMTGIQKIFKKIRK